MNIRVSKKAAKQISKLDRKISDAIYDYLETIDNKSFEEMQDAGMAELKGNLKGLLKFKYKTFSDYRLIGAIEGDRIIVILCCESRQSVYKNKDDLAKKIRGLQ